MKKFKIPIICPCNPVFPSPDEASIFLGLPSSPRQRLKLLHQYLNMGSPLPSDRSLDNIGKNGIRWKTIRRLGLELFRTLRKKIKLNELNYLSIKKKIHYMDLPFHWAFFIDSAIIGCKSSGAEIDESITFITSFFEGRSQDYQPLFDFLTNSAEPTEDNKFEFLFEYFDLSLNMTLLSQEEKFTFKKIVQTLPNINISCLQGSSKQAYLLVQYDFWISLMAVIDITFITILEKNIPKENTQENSICPNGLFGFILERHESTFLARFFAFIKEDRKTTYSELAKHVRLPISEYKKNGAEKEDIQKERFKEWRNGKSIPSISALLDYFEDLDCFELSIYAIFLRAIDKANKKDELGLIFNLEYYLRYYQHFKKMPLSNKRHVA